MGQATFSNFPDETLQAWTRDAAFVFSGRVQALGASNLDGVEPEDRMATVQVEDVALAPRHLGDLTGRTVTVYLETTEGLDVGQQATFFARSWHYGRNIGVVEVSGVREVGRASFRAGDIRQAVIAERLRQFEDQIEQRIRAAEVILSGRVLATFRVERPEGLPGLVEGVEWWNAELWIGTVEKGQPPADGRIWFPEGGDRGTMPNRAADSRRAAAGRSNRKRRRSGGSWLSIRSTTTPRPTCPEFRPCCGGSAKGRAEQWQSA